MTAVASPAASTGPVSTDLATSRRVQLLWGVAGLTAVAVVVELVVLRLFTRTVVHIPGAGDAAPGLSVLSEVGHLAFYVATVLLVVLVALVVRRLATSRGVVETSALAGVTVLAGVALGRRLDLVASSAADAAVIAAVLVVGIGAATRVESRARIPVVAFTAASTLAGIAMVAAHSSIRPDLRASAEILAVVAMATMPLAAPRRPDRISVLVGAIAAVLTWGALANNPTTPRILLLWNFGVLGTLPDVVYALVVASVLTALVWCWRSAARSRLAALVLVIAGGIGLHSTYQSALAVIGLALLVIAGPLGPVVQREEGSPARR